jgi:hypothetical protein
MARSSGLAEEGFSGINRRFLFRAAAAAAHLEKAEVPGAVVCGYMVPLLGEPPCKAAALFARKLPSTFHFRYTWNHPFRAGLAAYR